MKTQELRVLSVEDLYQKEKDLKKQLFDLKYQRKIGRVEKPSLFRSKKRDIARILTIVKEKETDGKKS